MVELRIKELLKQKGITAIKLSELMKDNGTPLSRVAIGAILNGTTKSPKVGTLIDMAKAANVDVRDFFTGESQDLFIKDGDDYKVIGKLYK